jgi:hypothetical protein
MCRKLETVKYKHTHRTKIMIDLQKQKNKNMLQNNITVIPEIKIINE